MKSPFLVRIFGERSLRGNTWTELSTGAITTVGADYKAGTGDNSDVSINALLIISSAFR